MRERKDTRIHLVAELEKLPQSELLEEIIREAKAGEYHDYKNNKYDCGKIVLVNKLYSANLKELSNRVRDGEFDEVADEDDKAEMRKGLPEAAWKIFKL